MRKDERYVEEREWMLIRVLKEIGISKERTIIERGESEGEEIRGKIKEMKEEI